MKRETKKQDIQERAVMLKPLAEEAHKILQIGKETNDQALIKLAADIMGMILDVI